MLQGQLPGSLPVPPQYKLPPPPAPPVAPKTPPATLPFNPYATDPGYQAAIQGEKLGSGSIDAGLNSQIQQRILALGDPNLAKQYGIDPSVLNAANASGNTALSRLGQAHQQNLQAIINRLASRGLLFSGDTGYQSGQEGQNYGHQVYDANQAALADLLNYQATAAQQKQALHQSVVDALQQAYQTYLAHPELGAYGQTPPQTTDQQIQNMLTYLSHTPDVRNGF